MRAGVSRSHALNLQRSRARHHRSCRNAAPRSPPPCGEGQGEVATTLSARQTCRDRGVSDCLSASDRRSCRLASTPSLSSPTRQGYCMCRGDEKESVVPAAAPEFFGRREFGPVRANDIECESSQDREVSPGICLSGRLPSSSNRTIEDPNAGGSRAPMTAHDLQQSLGGDTWKARSTHGRLFGALCHGGVCAR